eukprot:TRINITY_DN2241_c0_g1_i1.p1 TRINITY_DN2241_c0_g1~~TRINITY_DN2241_c0_g1_i1.p1  ORF type:complete len:385 (+),score=61.61 TRINITY_DN2241_c0_g1_i1:122-1276(+)
MPDLIYCTATAIICVLGYVAYYRSIDTKTRLYMKKGTWQSKLVESCPTVNSFSPAFLLVNSHLQTIGCKFARSAPEIEYEREYFPTHDGGQVALDWPYSNASKDSPVVLILHGLTGSSSSKYVRNLVQNVQLKGWRPVVLNARGCGTSIISTPIMYHAGQTEDLRNVIRYIKSMFSDSILLGVGYSMGGNILTKYLGEEGEHSLLSGAVSVSNPFDLWRLCELEPSRLGQQFYALLMARDLRNYAIRHRHALTGVDYDILLSTRTLTQFDECVTIPMFNFPSREHYYKIASCIHKMDGIRVPILFLNALDDPVVCRTCIPTEKAESNPNIMFALTEHGGHIGYLRNYKWWKKTWSDSVIEEYFSSLIQYKNEERDSNEIQLIPS